MSGFDVSWVALALIMMISAVAVAGVVGHLTQLEGRVDLLKGGNLPAIPLKVDDTVEPGDVIRTKSLSKAQITFIDNSILTLSQDARIAVEEFTFDPDQGKRHAVLEMFQGLALAVVNKILKAEEPDFVIKTQTAIVGVRGTEFGIRIQPNSSTILNFSGHTQVGNIFPEVSRLFLKAYRWPSPPVVDQWLQKWVHLRDMQGTRVARNLPHHAFYSHPPGPVAIPEPAHHLCIQPKPIPPSPGAHGLPWFNRPGLPYSSGDTQHLDPPNNRNGPAHGGAAAPDPPAATSQTKPHSTGSG